MKPGDIVVSLTVGGLLRILRFDEVLRGSVIVEAVKPGAWSSPMRDISTLRPLTPEEQAAYALGWRGPVLPSFASFPSVQIKDDPS